MPCLMLQLYKKEISFNDPCVTKYLAFDFDTSVRSVQLHTRAIQLSRFSYIRSRRKKKKKKKEKRLYALDVPDSVHLHYAKPMVERNCKRILRRSQYIIIVSGRQHNAFTSIHNHQPGSSRPRPCTHRILNINFLVRNGTCAILLHIHGKCFSCIAKIEWRTQHINFPSVNEESIRIRI